MKQLQGVAEFIINVRPGDEIHIPTDSNAAAGMLITTADTRDDAVALAEYAIKQIIVETQPL